MSEECNHDCASCKKDCGDRKTDFKVAANEMSEIGKVIGIISGKGGVGKSLVSCALASAARRSGKQVAVLDADITGPCVPKLFGLKEKAKTSELGIFPETTKTGIKVMSVNLLLERESDPVVWRGPIIAGTVKQFWTDVVWDDVDFMFVDMPPGTGDVPLTVFQSLPLDGIILVSSPQELVGIIVEKAAKMANLMKIPLLAFVENMSYFKCDGCGKIYNLFGESKIDALANRYGVDCVAKLPIDPKIAEMCDRGEVEDLRVPELDPIINKLLALE